MKILGVMVYLIAVLLPVLCGCRSAPAHTLPYGTEWETVYQYQEMTWETIVFDERKFDYAETAESDVEWEKLAFQVNPADIPISIDVTSISTVEQAIEVGDDILRQFRVADRLLEKELIEIVHLTDDNIWVCGYSMDQRNVDPMNLIDCDSFFAAIDGNDGNIIRMWAEE